MGISSFEVASLACLNYETAVKRTLDLSPGSLRVAAIQMNSGPNLSINLAGIETAVSRASRQGADAILFPECVTTGYTFDFSKLRPRQIQTCLESLSTLASRFKVHLLAGTPIFRGRKLFNALVVFDRAGHLSHVYAKCQLTESDRRWFTPGENLSLFRIDGIQATAIICHERRYPELVRIPVMAGARMIFHPNAGLDSLAVSKTKRGGRDGIPVRAFENAVPYIFANTVGPQGNDKWSAGDSKIVAANGQVLKLANNRSECLITADLDLTTATAKYALDSLKHPKILARHWPELIRKIQRGILANDRNFQSGFHRTTRPVESRTPKPSR